MKTCSEENCYKPLAARGLCGMHYMRARRKAKPLDEKQSSRAVLRVREWRAKNPERYRQQSREKRTRDPLTNYKQRAWNAVFRAISRGEVVRPSACSRCGQLSEHIQAHHENYEKWLDIVWLCPKCHQRYHNGYVRVERAGS
jgi:hypothetical protein